MALSLVVLAAGIGSRYRGLKQLEAVGPGGATLPEYAAFDALRAGFERLVLVVKPEIEGDVRLAFGDRIARRLPVVYAAQADALPAGRSGPPGRTKPWGTGHATLAAAEHLDGPFAVINADDFYGAGSYRLLADFLRQKAAGHVPVFGMVSFALRDTLSPEGPVSRGVCDVDDAGFLRSIREVVRVVAAGDDAIELEDSGAERTLAGATPVSLNFWGFTPAFLPVLEAGFRRFLERNAQSTKAEYYLVAAVQQAVATGAARVRVLGGGGPWAGLTYPGDLRRLARQLESLVAAGAYPEHLWQ
jgi:hypothetical protein